MRRKRPWRPRSRESQDRWEVWHGWFVLADKIFRYEMRPLLFERRSTGAWLFFSTLERMQILTFVEDQVSCDVNLMHV